MTFAENKLGSAIIASGNKSLLHYIYTIITLTSSKKHVFQDLRSYVCFYNDYPFNNIIFVNRDN
jgi:hypothetical protein